MSIRVINWDHGEAVLTARRRLPLMAGVLLPGGVTLAVATVVARADVERIGGRVWWTFAFLPLLLAGALIAALRPRSVLGWLLLTVSTAAELTQLQTVLLAASRSGSSQQAWLLWMGDITWWLTVPLIPLVLALLPDGSGGQGRTRWVVRGGLLMWVLLGASIVFEPRLGARSSTPTTISNPVAIDRVATALDWLSNIGKIGLALTFLASLVLLAARWRAAKGAARRRLWWLIAPVLIGGVAIAADTVAGTANGSATQAGLVMLLIGLPIAICAAVISDQLPDFGDVAQRVAMYGVVGVLLTGTYVLLVLSVSSLIHGSGRDLGVIIATASVAILFAPVRDRVRRLVDRWLLGEATDPAVAMSRLADAFTRHGDTPDLASLVHVFAEAVGASCVQLTMSDGQIVEQGTTHEVIIRRPLLWAGESVGALAICLHPARTVRASDEKAALELIDALCPILAAAVRTISLINEVQQSRAGLVTAIEEERRSIRRDLHDGLGPALAGIGLGLDTILNLAPNEPSDYHRRLVQVRDDVGIVYEDLRLLARGLRPTVLDELGLLGALHNQTLRLGSGDESPVITIQCDGDPNAVRRLPAAVELAAYHVVMEALTNVVRHATATTCEVTVSRQRDLRLEIRDNGRGAATRSNGVGLTSMRERCEQLGGHLELSSSDGTGTGTGTIVTALLPIQ